MNQREPFSAPFGGVHLNTAFSLYYLQQPGDLYDLHVLLTLGAGANYSADEIKTVKRLRPKECQAFVSASPLKHFLFFQYKAIAHMYKQIISQTKLGIVT